MKTHTLLTILLLTFAAEIAVLLRWTAADTNSRQDVVAVNEAVRSVQLDWGALENHRNQTDLDYVVLDADESVLFKTKDGLSESLNAAVAHRDTILEIEVCGAAAGKIIVYNDSAQVLQQKKLRLILSLIAAVLVQLGACAGYTFYLNHTIVKPFHKLKGFAERIADGNLDIPLEMDRGNLFGAFTEGFDIMRSELKKARIAEAKANAGKKELVAKLSHDIKTPLASIKAAAEVGAALTNSERLRDNYTQIIHKADQINTLITNLFTATLEELQELSVTPRELESGVLRKLLESSDYLHRAALPDIPDCLLYADRLRLQQVFDNIFANSYKYADRKCGNSTIDVTITGGTDCLTVSIEDHGGGVSPGELPLLKEKFRRGSNTEGIEGAGLGLYISDYFMKEMHGRLIVENGQKGLRTTVLIPLSGSI